jgi:hypothetical protein
MPYWLGIREFHLNPQGMKVLRSRVAAVSTEVYWIALRTDGYEFDRIPGELVGAFVDAGEQQSLDRNFGKSCV